MSKNKENSKKNKVVNMREAFESVAPKLLKRSSDGKRFSLRDLFWNYPDLFIKLVKLTAPLSSIIIFGLVGCGVFFLLRSESFAKNISSLEFSQYIEGRIGAISTFNPLFSNQNDIDKAVQELVFEKFVDVDINGNIVPEIATSWSISDDGKTYDFDISKDHIWSDGEPLTVEDVLFTFETGISLSVNQGYDTIGSALSDTQISVVDDDTIRFVLPETSAIFPETVAVYIVPKHILENVNLEDMPFDMFATSPIGSGPYRITNSDTNEIYLEASSYYPVSPKISNIIIRLYSDVSKLEVAFRNGLLDGMVLQYNQDSDFVKEYSAYTSTAIDLPYRERLLFFNIRKEKFQSEELRKGLSYLVDKTLLLEQSGIYGTVINGPIYEGSWAYNSSAEYLSYDVTKATESLKSAGYTKNEQNGYYQTEDGKLLTFTVSYLENDTNSKLLETFKTLMNDQGVIVNLESLSYSQLTQEILATRDFEVLMYEVELSVDPDQYNLWHSLQKEYPNLNLSGYEYERVDILLEEARGEIDKDTRIKDYSLFQRYLVADAPVIFLYRPSYLYVVRNNISGIEYENIVRLEDVYSNIYNWQFK